MHCLGGQTCALFVAIYGYFIVASDTYIVFSERCTLKKVSLTIPTYSVIKRDKLLPVLHRDIANRHKVLSDSQINSAYTILKEYSLADDATKARHIRRINEKARKYS